MKWYDRFWQTGVSLWRRLRGSRLEKFLAGAIMLGSLTFVALALWRGWGEVAPSLQHVDGWLLAAAEGCILVALLLGGITWAWVQQGMGLGFGFGESLGVHFLSAITKYLPGYAWQFLSKAYLVRGRQVSPGAIGLALLTEFVLLLLGGGVLAFALAGWYGPAWPVIRPIPRWVWLAAGTFTGLSLTGYLGWLVRRLKTNGQAIAARCLWLALAAGTIGWGFFALAAWLAARSLLPVAVADLPQAAFALILAMLASILVLFVPGGVGVREMALAFLLQGMLPLSLGVTVSLLLRLGVVLGELGGFGLAFLARQTDSGLLRPRDYPQ
jgi:hypothetical protein